MSGLVPGHALMGLMHGLQRSPKRSIPQHFVSMSNDPLKLHLEVSYLEEIGRKGLWLGRGVEGGREGGRERDKRLDGDKEGGWEGEGERERWRVGEKNKQRQKRGRENERGRWDMMR